MGAGGGGGSTSIDVPPQIGQIGQATTGLAAQEQQFLSQGLSLGNYGIALATGGQGQQISGGGATTYDIAAGTGLVSTQQGLAQPVSGGVGAQAPAGTLSGAQVIQAYNKIYGVDPPNANSLRGARNIAGGPYASVPTPDGGSISMFELMQRAGMDQGQAPASPGAQTGADWANSPQANQFAPTTQIGGQSGYTFPNGANISPAQIARFMTATPYEQALVAQAIGMSPDQLKALFTQAQATGGTGITAPAENPLYGPWINTAISAIQGEARGAQTLAGMMGTAAQREAQYYGRGQDVYGQAGTAFAQGTQMIGAGTDILGRGTEMLGEATTGTGLFPSQQRLVEAQVKAGQAQIAQQLASEGLSASTLGPELSAEIGLQGAATAGGLIQGNIAAAQAEQGIGIQEQGVGIQEQGIGVNLQQAAQGWAQLAQGEQTIGFGEQQALTNLFSTIAAQGSAMQAQFWQQGLQGYGLEGAFFNQTLQAYGTSLNAYNVILQASETQAQVNAQIENANTAANAAIIGSVIEGVSSIASSAVKACWVARAVFGPQNARWRLFRFWLSRKAPRWFAQAYLKHGAAFAQWLEGKPRCKSLVRLVMNLILAYGR